MSKRGQKAQNDSSIMNNKTYQQYYNRLTELAISMFEWKNLPESVDPRFLELTLFTDGQAIFFRDEVMGELALQCMIGGNLDVYRVPMVRTAYATNGYNRKLDTKDSVIIYNNYLRTNSLLDIEMYARRLYELERTIDVNIIGQKTPTLIQCSENQRLVMKNLYMQYTGNEPFLFGDKNLDLSGIKVFQTQAPYVADKLNQLKHEIFNEALTYLGISNVNIQKKERLLSDEVSRNMGSIEAQKYTRLNARKEACAKINKMFALNIDVEYREDVKMLEEVDESEDDVNE
jgi:hypothetical protein